MRAIVGAFGLVLTFVAGGIVGLWVAATPPPCERAEAVVEAYQQSLMHTDLDATMATLSSDPVLMVSFNQSGLQTAPTVEGVVPWPTAIEGRDAIREFQRSAYASKNWTRLRFEKTACETARGVAFVAGRGTHIVLSKTNASTPPIYVQALETFGLRRDGAGEYKIRVASFIDYLWSEPPNSVPFY